MSDTDIIVFSKDRTLQLKSLLELAGFLRDVGYEMRDTADTPVDSLGSGEYICEAKSGARTLN